MTVLLSRRLGPRGRRCPVATTARVSYRTRLFGALSHLDEALVLPVWLIYVYVLRRTHCDFSDAEIDCDGLQLRFLVDVDGLDDMVRPVEYYERVSRDVGLR